MTALPATRWAPLAELAASVRGGATSARALTQRALDRIGQTQPTVNAFTQVWHDHALARADAIDASIKHGHNPGELAGVPVAVKDNLCTQEGLTTCASRMLANYRSPFDAAVVERLLAQGAVIVGKTNLDEFAMGSSTESGHFGPTRNPHDLSRVAGGSSGGSAAAVAAGCVPLALGSDTGGSIRQPASHCGVVGLKPTYGRVSRWGLVAYASSLDQVGPITGRVTDCALATRLIAGADPRDSTCAPIDPSGLDVGIEAPVNGLVIGVPREARGPGVDPGVLSVLESTLTRLRSAGATLRDIDLPHSSHAIAAYYLIATAEASSNLARFDGVRYGHRAALAPGEGLDALYRRSRSEGFGPEVRKRIMLGTHALSSGYYDAYYGRALKVRRLIKQDHDRAFAPTDQGGAGCTVILMPAATGPAFLLGGKSSNDPLAMYLEDVFTVALNLAGLPGLSVPAGQVHSGGKPLPVGLQVIGPALSENIILRVAGMIECAYGL